MPPPSFLYLSIAKLPPATVVVGQEYPIRLRLSANPGSDAKVGPIARTSNLLLQIHNVSGNWVRGGLVRPLTLPADETFLEHEVILTPTNEASEVQLGISLQTGGMSKLFPLLKIEVQDVQAQSQVIVEARPSGEPEVEVEPPVNFASLYIGTDAQHWRFTYRSPANEVEKVEVQAWANTTALSLEALFAVHPNQNRVKARGIAIAAGLPIAIKTQLERLIQTGAVLQIMDQTATDIPWEMAYLETAAKQGFLGALCGVVRQVGGVTGEDPNSPGRSLTLGGEAQPGEVLAFLADPEYLAGTDPEHLALQQLCARLCAGRDEFLTKLETQDDSVALVYVASHGNGVVDAPNQATLWLAQETEIAAEELLATSLQLVAKAHPLIFVNACYSAQMGPIGGWDRFGLPSPFLRRQARGYLGAVGKVYTEFAAEFGKLFLERLQADGAEPVAQILRELRAAAVQTASGMSQEEAGRYLLTTFMYVYYGMPLARVQVRQPAPGGQP